MYVLYYNIFHVFSAEYQQRWLFIPGVVFRLIPHLVEYKCIDALATTARVMSPEVKCSGNTHNAYTHNAHITHTCTNPWGLKPHQTRHFWGEIQARDKERAKSKRHKEGKKNKVQSPQPEHRFTGWKEKEDERASTGIVYHSQPNQWTQKKKNLHVQTTQQKHECLHNNQTFNLSKHLRLNVWAWLTKYFMKTPQMGIKWRTKQLVLSGGWCTHSKMASHEDWIRLA